MRMKRGKYYYDFLDTVEKLRKEDNSCYICGSTKNVHPHHIHKVPDNSRKYAKESNIVLLCDNHHYRFHLKYGSDTKINRKNFVIFCKKELEKEFERQTELLKFDLIELLKEYNNENGTSIPFTELENRLSHIIIKYKEKCDRLKQKNDDLKITKNIIEQNTELKKENYKLQRENNELKKENKKLKKRNNKLNKKIDAAEFKPGVKQYNELIKENSKLKKENNNLKQQIEELADEINRIQHKQDNTTQQTTFLKLNYGGWGIIGKYCRTDEPYSKKASLLKEYLKKHIGKNTVTVNSDYVKIVIKKNVSIRKLYEVLLIDDDIPYELEYTEHRKIIYFEWSD